eukprot:jgi/Picre1/34432/NNA_001900.t1
MEKEYCRSIISDIFAAQHRTVDNFVKNIDIDSMTDLAQCYLSNKAAIVTTGVGKSSYIAEKMSKMLVSYGLTSHFLNPLNCMHGDMGVLRANDYIFCFSKSGKTEELLTLIPHFKLRRCCIVAITCSEANELSASSDFHIHLPLDQENCPLGVSPVSSSILQLLFADSFVSVLASLIIVDHQTYKENHPAGNISKLLRVAADVMRPREECPSSKPTSSILVAVQELCGKGTGCLTVLDDHDHVLGVVTDGDIRRALSLDLNLTSTLVKDIMTSRPVLCPCNSKLKVIREMLKGAKVSVVPVISQDGKFLGSVSLSDVDKLLNVVE